MRSANQEAHTNLLVILASSHRSTLPQLRHGPVIEEGISSLPVRAKDQVPVCKPSSDQQPNKLQEASNDWQLVHSVNNTRCSPDGHK